jgi:hypothetical protein
MSVLDRFRTAAASPLEERRTLDRRQLLKAGAWAAPVLVLATAAPAAAASTDPADAGGAAPAQPGVDIAVYTFAQDNYDVIWDGPTQSNRIVAMKGQAAFTNLDATRAITSLTLTLTVPALGMTEGRLPEVTSGAGWRAVSAVRTGSNMIYTFLFTGNVVGKDTTSPLLQYRLAADGTQTPAAKAGTKGVGIFSGDQVKTLTKEVFWT